MSPASACGQLTVAELVAAITQQPHNDAADSVRQQTPCTDSAPHGSASAVVLGAHPGVGASGVALALADAAARRQPTHGKGRVCLVDTAPHESSGLIFAAVRELGPGAQGWRVGVRGPVEIYRPSAAVASPSELPESMAMEAGRLVVDAGWPLRDLQAVPNPIRTLMAHAPLVLVLRATVPGVRRAEAVLADLPGRPLVVGIGARRWPGQVRATFGPRLTEAYETGRCVLLPFDRQFEINGICPSPLPKAFTVATSRLLDLVWPLFPTATPLRSKESS